MNEARQRITLDGKVLDGAYSATDTVNSRLPATGTDVGDRTWGANGSQGLLCVTSLAVYVFVEVYPKNEDGVTTKTRYGAANDQYRPLQPGRTNIFDMRLPVLHDFGGNTGDLNGYLTYNGHRIDLATITVRVWPNDHGAACGVQGFSANYDQIAYSTSRDATYYLVRGLAGGQCGASTQSYRVYFYCKDFCGQSGIRSSGPINVNIGNGTRPALNYAF
jgi:hypothetical protein